MTQRRKVLIASTNADLAGAPIHVLTLISRLKEEFEIVTVFGEDGPIRQAILDMGLRALVISNLKSDINPISDVLSLLTLMRLVLTEKPSLIHVHSSKAGLIGRLTGFLLRIPCIYTVHGWGFGQGRPRLQSLFVRLAESILSFLPGSTYVFVSEADRQIGIQQLKLSPQECVTIHNGVIDHGCRADVAHHSSAIMAARVCYAKNHTLLLEAFEACKTEFNLTLAGEGTDTDEFRGKVFALAPRKAHLIKCLGLSNKVPMLLAESGVFVLCSRYEGLPLSMIEAMCAGLPVVAVDVGGVRELVEDGVSGFLVPPNNKESLSLHLDTLQQDSSMRASMGRAGRIRYEAMFSDKAMTDKVRNLYCTLLSTQRIS